MAAHGPPWVNCALLLNALPQTRQKTAKAPTWGRAKPQQLRRVLSILLFPLLGGRVHTESPADTSVLLQVDLGPRNWMGEGPAHLHFRSFFYIRDEMIYF